MKLSARETRLIAAAGAIILLGMTYWIGEGYVKKWRDAAAEMQTLGAKMELTQRLIEQKPMWEERLQNFRNQLPRHAQNKEVVSELLKTLEKLARDNSLVLLRREPEKERVTGDLSEVAIQCLWESDLEALVRFLYAVQMQGVILDIQQLSVTPAQGSPGKLKGSFTVECAFGRTSAATNSAVRSGSVTNNVEKA